MPSTIGRVPDFELPEDLIQLQRDLDARRRETDEYVAAVEADLAAQPAPPAGEDGEPARPTWSTEQDAELNRLRTAYMAAAKAKWAHPALQPGSKFEDALRAAARA